MRILHTADWHLCDRLGRIDRTNDLKTRVEQIADYCEEHRVDVLLVAGDLFSEQATPDQMADAFAHLRSTFRPFLDRRGTILAITGNHDRDTRINLVRAGMSLAAPPTTLGGTLTPGRAYLLNQNFFGLVPGPDGEEVQFVFVPYPFRSRYDLPEDRCKSLEAQNTALKQAVVTWVRDTVADARFRVDCPTVLTAHLHVRGSETHSLYKMTEREDVLLDFADLNPSWAYIALGHIHKPQALGGADTVRYPGSLDRLDIGERHDDHGVCLVDVSRTSATRVQRLPIAPTPFHHVVLTDPATELPGLAERYPDRERAIVQVTAPRNSPTMSRDEIERTVRKIFPRLHVLRYDDAPAPVRAEVTPTFRREAGFASTVRTYLEQRLTGSADREALLTLAESFLQPDATK